MSFKTTRSLLFIIGLLKTSLTFGNHNDLNDADARTKMGKAVLRVDCPTNDNGECEPPIMLSWQTPYSVNQESCKEYQDPEYGETEHRRAI